MTAAKLQRPNHFDVIAVIGCKEIGAYQKKDNIRSLQLLADFSREVLTCSDAPIVPGCDHVLPPEHREMDLQLISQRLIPV